MKVAVVASFARSLVVFRGHLLQTLVQRGHRVVALAPDFTGDLRGVLHTWGVQPVDYPLVRQGTSVQEDAAAYFALLRIFQARSPDVVLGYTIKPVIYGTLAARRAGVPRVAALVTGLGAVFLQKGGTWRMRLLRWGVSRLYRHALNRADVVFVQNPDDQAFLQNHLGVRQPLVRLPGSGVDLQHFTPAPYPETPTFLMMARLIPDKGVREYVAAARRVKQRFPHARFLLAGWLEPRYPGAITREALEGWIREGVVDYLGFLEDVRPALAQSSVYVLPSYREGTPRSVLEALAMGRPVITTDAPGCRETVRHGENGFLVPVRDVEALEEAMVHFLEHPEDIPRMGEASRRLAENVFDVQKVTARILATLHL